LLNQADAEVLLQELDARRIRTALERMNASRVVVTRPKKPTPFAFAFPLIIGRLREKVSTESSRIASSGCSPNSRRRRVYEACVVDG